MFLQTLRSLCIENTELKTMRLWSAKCIFTADRFSTDAEKELSMPFESVWGFDPERVTQAQSSSHSEAETDGSTYSAAEERAAHIPGNAESQVYELRRMYRL
jgi:hypothetical protein